MALLLRRRGPLPLLAVLLIVLLGIHPPAGAESADNCVGDPTWGNCTDGNVGFRHPKYDTIAALQVDEEGARIVIDGDLGDWAEHPQEHRCAAGTLRRKCISACSTAHTCARRRTLVSGCSSLKLLAVS